MIHYVETDGNVVEVDESKTLPDIIKEHPAFFETPLGIGECIEAYRGCIITLCWRPTPDSLLKTINAYIFFMKDGKPNTIQVTPHRYLDNFDEAKELIDTVMQLDTILLDQEEWI
jgi:hypothetical protein